MHVCKVGRLLVATVMSYRNNPFFANFFVLEKRQTAHHLRYLEDTGEQTAGSIPRLRLAATNPNAKSMNNNRFRLVAATHLTYLHTYLLPEKKKKKKGKKKRKDTTGTRTISE